MSKVDILTFKFVFFSLPRTQFQFCISFLLVFLFNGLFLLLPSYFIYGVPQAAPVEICTICEMGKENT